MNFTGILHLLLNYPYFVDNIAREVESDREASQGLVVVAQLVDEAVERVEQIGCIRPRPAPSARTVNRI